MFGAVAIGVFAVAMLVGIVALGNSVSNIREAEVAHSPAKLLADAGAKEDKLIALPVTYYDQISDVCVDLYDANKAAEVAERQRGWTECGYTKKQLEQGLAKNELGENGLPVAAKGSLLTNRGVNFGGWFEE